MNRLVAIVAASLAAGIAGAGGHAVVELLPPDPVSRAVASRARADARALVAPPDRYEITAYRYGGGEAVPAGAVTIELVESDGPNRSGYVRLRYRVLVDGMPRGEARATLRGVVRGPALVAREVLSRGEPVPAGAVAIEDVDVTRLTDAPLRDVAALREMVPLRTLGRDRVLTAGLIEPRPVVHRGDTVDVRVATEGLTVTTKGRALRNGAPGETVPAENVRTGARFLARVEPDGTLHLVRGAVERR